MSLQNGELPIGNGRLAFGNSLRLQLFPEHCSLSTEHFFPRTYDLRPSSLFPTPFLLPKNRVSGASKTPSPLPAGRWAIWVRREPAQIGADWCVLVRIGAFRRELVRSGANRRGLARIGADSYTKQVGVAE